MVSPVTRLVPERDDRSAQRTAAGRIRQFVGVGSGLATITRPQTNLTMPLSHPDIANHINSEKVIPGYDAGPAPDGSFATVVNINAAISRTIQQPNRIWAEVHDRVSVQWFRENALNRALTFTAWVFSPEASELAIGLGLVVLGTTPLRDLSDLISEQWEERANVDVGFGYTIDVVDSQGNPAGLAGVAPYFRANEFAPGGRAFSTEVVSDLDRRPVFRITYEPP